MTSVRLAACSVPNGRTGSGKRLQASLLVIGTLSLFMTVHCRETVDDHTMVVDGKPVPSLYVYDRSDLDQVLSGVGLGPEYLDNVVPDADGTGLALWSNTSEECRLLRLTASGSWAVSPCEIPFPAVRTQGPLRDWLNLNQGAETESVPGARIGEFARAVPDRSGVYFAGTRGRYQCFVAESGAPRVALFHTDLAPDALLVRGNRLFLIGQTESDRQAPTGGEFLRVVELSRPASGLHQVRTVLWPRPAPRGSPFRFVDLSLDGELALLQDMRDLPFQDHWLVASLSTGTVSDAGPVRGWAFFLETDVLEAVKDAIAGQAQATQGQ